MDTYAPIESLEINEETDLRCNGCSSPAVIFCKECLEVNGSSYYCLNCSKVIHNLKMFKNHTLQEITQNKQLIKITKNEKFRFCKKHNKKLKVFCFDDKKMLCHKCAFSDHEGHHLKIISLAVESYKNIYFPTPTQIGSLIEKNTNFVKLISNSSKEVKSQQETQLKNVENGFSEIIEMLEKKKKTIQNEIIESSKVQMEKLNELFFQKKDTIEQYKGILKNLDLIKTKKLIKTDPVLYFHYILPIMDVNFMNEEELKLPIKIDSQEKSLNIGSVLRVIKSLKLSNIYSIKNCFVRIGRRRTFTPIIFLVEIRNHLGKAIKNFKGEIILIIENQNGETHHFTDFYFRSNEGQPGIVFGSFEPKSNGIYKVTKLHINDEVKIIDNLAFEYYNHSHTFKSSGAGRSIMISNGNLSAMHIESNYYKALDSQVALNQLMVKGKYNFCFRIESHLTGCVSFGVIPKNSVQPAYKCGWTFCVYCPNRFACGKNLGKWGEKFSKNDIIKINVNMDSKRMTVYKNNKKIGIVHKNFGNDLIFACSLLSTNSKISIVHQN
ncbi:hypothetical protein M0812_26817 [Anaeramoeba flamelloides]|uniref:B box-type domain-containing protein n=1 Tax=Anaeramoeba flamelloides TaxID=1746091 RepID=A0AAV7YF58_9EUKA|nr:hypothetical protein M0812_26817 [Anaeramoeba flamelloides]